MDRATCADFSGLKGVGKNECEIAGCCFDSYASECYDSSPKSRDPYPNTGECQVESEKRETCGFGLSKSDCAEMTGKFTPTQEPDNQKARNFEAKKLWLQNFVRT